MARQSAAEKRAAKEAAEANPPAEPTGPVEEATAQAEAERRADAEQPAPTPADVQQADNAADAQLTADTAALMGPNSDSAEAAQEAETIDERMAREQDTALDTIAGKIAEKLPQKGMTTQDMQNAQNVEVAMLAGANRPKEVLDQQKDAATHIRETVGGDPRRRGGPLPTNRSLSLEEMGKAKVYT